MSSFLFQLQISKLDICRIHFILFDLRKAFDDKLLWNTDFVDM